MLVLVLRLLLQQLLQPQLVEEEGKRRRKKRKKRRRRRVRRSQMMTWALVSMVKDSKGECNHDSYHHSFVEKIVQLYRVSRELASRKQTL